MTNFKTLDIEIDTLKALFDDIDTITNSVGLVPEGPMCTALHKLVDPYIVLLKRLYDDKYDWIRWYVFDNDFGKNAYIAGFDNVFKKISTVDELIWLLQFEGNTNENS